MADDDVREWLAAGDVSKVRGHLDAHAAEGWMLRAAAAVCHVELCTVLLKAGCDANAADEDGRTPLMAACSAAVAEGAPQALIPQAKRVVSLLLNHGAEAGAADKDGATAPDIAKQANELKWVFKMASMMRADPPPQAKPASSTTPVASPTPQSATKRALFPKTLSLEDKEAEADPTPKRRVSIPPLQAATPSPREPYRSAAGSPATVDTEGEAAPAESTYDYLNRVLFPVLNPALNEIAAARPADPVAHLISMLSVAQKQGAAPAQLLPAAAPAAYTTPVRATARPNAHSNVRSYTTGGIASATRERTPRSTGGLSAMRNRR
eukprot:TRINITY_DN20415_c0_g1_i1.p2 TRINITY_DN20415_c0_g1~~TRINITY_DN20415_c0_g1_i1.p2  ORF type:complete len:323 (+),score=93.43 TRINITY_DN20415_c0_g1_i1:48-1016(+)